MRRTGSGKTAWPTEQPASRNAPDHVQEFSDLCLIRLFNADTRESLALVEMRAVFSAEIFGTI